MYSRNNQQVYLGIFGFSTTLLSDLPETSLLGLAGSLLGGSRTGVLLSSESLLSILNDGKLDTITLGEGDHWLVTLAKNENVRQSSGECSTNLVSEMDDLIVTGVLLSGSDNTNSTNTVTTRHHGNVSNIELNDIQNLTGGDINLNGVVNLDLWVRELESSSIVSDGVRDLVVTHEGLGDLAKLERGLLLLDLVNGETSLGCPQKSEVLVGLINVDNIHKTSGESHVGSDLSVNLDELLHNDHLSLVVGQSVLQSVAKQDDEWERSGGLVWTWRRLWGLRENNIQDRLDVINIPTCRRAYQASNGLELRIS